MKAKQFLINYVSLFFLLSLTITGLYSSWWEGPLYARVQLNLFYNVHGLSVLFICASAFWLWRKDSLPVAVFAAFGIASLHELILDGLDLGLFHVSSGISPVYALYLSVFLVIGFLLSKTYHKTVWLFAVPLLVLFFVATSHIYINGGSTTIDSFLPGPGFYNPYSNATELVGWLLPSLLWFLPRDWFAWRSPSP